ncbi:hypothetical protein K490DRAFT_38273 [Saccharata proteae CBS 121410]|uniref:Inclusion body clearance protein IML2 n=1 Tax=Saccharata proteae CBS 121410 TaxID=1314787 RepID=A0A6A5YBN2_9PEZI|nr:hypothetical protein K490DRAFT_38273 [Saccharata proteae CBS 121410]
MPLGSWLGGSKSKAHGSTQSLNALEEPQQLEDAMRAVAHIMNDDVDTAELLLGKGSSPFHKLGKGVVIFLRATLGFEQEVMREASDILSTAETSASEYQRKAQRGPPRSSIYPAGSEFALCLAQAQLMGAIVAVLNESLTESIRGFYKLRKAFIALDAIMEAERLHLGGKAGDAAAANASRTSLASRKSMPTSLRSGVTEQTRVADAQPVNAVKKETAGTDVSSLNIAIPDNGPDPDFVGNNPTDVFIHSGANMCFGVLMLVMSMIPPAFGTLLKIAGFRGDRERGISMLWQATKFDNIYGGLAGLIILGYYNGMIGFCDIIPDSGEGSYPKERCKTLLTQMRQRYPKSRLWQLEDARMLASDKQLEAAVSAMKTSEKSQLKQVEALQCFERSLDCMYMHDYEQCAESFLLCVSLNNWSHGLYYYIAGCAHVELYRTHKSSGDAKKAAAHAAKAEELLKLVPKNTGKKRFMARQLPFDVFVNRKLQKWEQGAKDRGVPFVDAIGVSPIEEVIWFWNGYKRMQPAQLDRSLAALDWSPDGVEDSLDERAIRAVLRATTMRNAGKTAEAKALLQKEVIQHDWQLFKGGFKDNWTQPAAHYEMAANLWMEREGRGVEVRGDDEKRLRECSVWLEKVARWESYDLDARIGLKVTTARDTLKRFGIEPSP